MARAIAVKIGGEVFATKEAAKAFIRALVARYALGDYLNEADTLFCLELFKRHSDYPQKLHPGVLKIQVRSQDHGTRGFQIFKTDGTNDDISWHHCINHSG